MTHNIRKFCKWFVEPDLINGQRAIWQFPAGDLKIQCLGEPEEYSCEVKDPNGACCRLFTCYDTEVGRAMVNGALITLYAVS
jgi:hypothetical protein